MLTKPQHMSPQQFEKLCNKVYDLCGINLKKGKEELVHSRLHKRLNALKLETFEQYFNYLDHDKQGNETIWMIDALTTNKTSFFREIQHFEFLKERVLPNLQHHRLRIWSAACSTGEEPYSIAIMLAESLSNFKSWDIRILATDISTKVLGKAKEAVYEADLLEPIPSAWRQKYFIKNDTFGKSFRVVPHLRNLVSLARLNFMDKFPMHGPFDVIFCRNAMIYFDKPTQENLVRRFYDLIAPGGYLFVGHSESLTGANHNFKYIQPAV
ncbi:MAG TPA: protein-glutamate O-methyltransferase CheR, partial [Pyrinomonadaceae bacterium]|nr:protein-glutamate O-methyltransferase CheR [Pyrinomonadaceae bacterium]